MGEPEGAAHAAPAPARFYKPELDGLRLLAFLMVFVHHAMPNEVSPRLAHLIGHAGAAIVAGLIRTGGFGVDLFFVLSSYLITELLLREHDRRGTVDIKAFYIRRALRIWPLYFSFLILIGVVLPSFGYGLRLSGTALVAFATFVANWYTGFYGYPPSSVAPLWSVSLEEQFYLCWPIVVRFISIRHLARVALAMIAASLIARTILTSAHMPLAIWNFTVSRLDPIATGILLAMWMRARPAFDVARPIRPVLAGCGFGCFLLVTLVWRLDQSTMGLAWLGYPLISVGALLLLVAAKRAEGKSILANPALVYLGRISYGLYVFHVFALGVAARIADRLGLRQVASGLIALIVTVALAACSYHLLEKPFLHLKQRFTYVPSRVP